MFVEVIDSIARRGGFELLDHIEDTSKEVDRFKTGDRDGYAIAFGDWEVILITGNCANVSGSEEALDAVFWIGEDGVEGWGDQDVGDQG